MALGDGIRRNIAHVSQAERDQLRDAILQLHETPIYPGGPSMWAMQDAIHEATHVHGGPAFLPWHRELCNRFEEMLRVVNPQLSLHYWDWTTDPRDTPDGLGGTVNLFTPEFMGSAAGDAGEPLTPLGTITRNLDPGAPGVSSDAVILASADGLPEHEQFAAFRGELESSHNGAHTFFGFGSTIGNGHTAFEDPFVFLLHSNVDRLWAMWQTAEGEEWRLDPDRVYGDEAGTTGGTGIATPMEPWAGIDTELRPWAPPENQQEVKDSRHPSVVRPPCYDTLPVDVDLIVPDVMGAPITFNDVPEGIAALRTPVFRVRACMPLTFTVTAGPGAPFVLHGPGAVVTAPNSLLTAEARIWIRYTGTVDGDNAMGSISIHCEETGQDWMIPIVANTIAWPAVASALVLDRSGSMDWESGVPGKKRMDVLKDAAPVFVQLMPDTDAIGVVQFNHDAAVISALAEAGPPVIGTGRANATTAISALVADGGTSIGDGVFAARGMLNGAAGFPNRAIVVFTDGHENDARFLSDPEVTDALDAQVFALGLGTAEFLNPIALDALVSGSGGFMLMTGALGSEDLLRLHKYFVQILAGVTNTAIVVDPPGRLYPGQEHRIPFHLADADAVAEVLLLSPAPYLIDFTLETPSGAVIDPATAGLAGASFVQGGQVDFYRMGLPVALGAGEHAGRWHAVLRLHRRDTTARTHGFRQETGAGSGIPYSLNVQARSSLRMHAQTVQSSRLPGASVLLRARLTEYDQPLAGRARVDAHVVRPDGTQVTLSLAEVEPGVFSREFTASLPGIYPITFRAEGKTWHGGRFTREELRTAAVWRRGDDDAPRTPPRGSGTRELCEAVRCLAADPGVAALLERHGIRPEAVARCLCQGGGDGKAGAASAVEQRGGCLGALGRLLTGGRMR